MWGWVLLTHVLVHFDVGSSYGCWNLGSCANSRVSDSSGSYCYCLAELSCDNAFIDGNDNSYTVDCSSSHACRNATITNVTTLYLYGSFAAQNATVYNSKTTMIGWSSSYFGTYGLTIYCNDSSVCSMDCPGNSCQGLTMICDDTSSCTITDTQTYVSLSGTPEYYRNGFDIITPISESYSYIYETSKHRRCDVYGECDAMTIDLDNSNNENLYCLAGYACDSSVITMSGSIDISINNNNTGSNVYCTAYRSCSFATIISNDDNNNTIVCDPSYSCYYTKMYGFSHVYALAFPAISYAKIYSNNNNQNEMNVYFGGAWPASGDGASIYCNVSDTCNIYCDTFSGCRYITVYCYGTCNVYCSTGIAGACPTVYDLSLSPTGSPTDPSNAPTKEPTPVPTADTGAPTLIPTMIPTEIPQNEENGVNVTNETMNGNENNFGTQSTQDTDGNGNENENENEQLISDSVAQTIDSWEIGGYIFMGSAIITPLLLLFIGLVYHKHEKYHGCDEPNYFALFSCFWNFGDFYSDLIFAVILVLTSHYLWYFAVFFSVIPHFVSNFVSLYHIQKYQNKNVYMSKYVNKYDWFIILVSCLAGFYTAIELARSKIFYVNAFSLQLKRRDYNKIQNLRLFNTVIFENLGQIVIQALYISDTGVDIFVISAMFFSIASTLISIFQAISRKMKQDAAVSGTEGLKNNRTYKMKIECDKLHHYHKYCHDSLTNTLCSVLNIDNTGNIEVFYVYPIRKALVSYMEISNVDKLLLNQYKLGPNAIIDEKSKEKLFSQIEEIGKEGGSLNESFKQEFCAKLGFDFANSGNMKVNSNDTMDTNGVSSVLQPGQSENMVGDNMRVSIWQDSKAASSAASSSVESGKLSTQDSGKGQAVVGMSGTNSPRQGFGQANASIPLMPMNGASSNGGGANYYNMNQFMMNNQLNMANMTNMPNMMGAMGTMGPMSTMGPMAPMGTIGPMGGMGMMPNMGNVNTMNGMNVMNNMGNINMNAMNGMNAMNTMNGMGQFNQSGNVAAMNNATYPSLPPMPAVSTPIGPKKNENQSNEEAPQPAYHG